MHRNNLLLSIIIAIKFILQYLLIHPVYDLQRDEYLHLDQGLHLAWGFISVPPLTSWISYLIHMLGGSVFWIKFFPAAFGALTLILVWKMIEKLGGNLFACLLGTLALLISPLLRVNTLFQPNSSDIFFWTLAFYVLISWIQTNETRWIYIAAVTIALGFYSKYNILMFVAAVFPALLLTSHRNIFANKHVYFAIVLAFLMVLPNLLWQYHNNFPTFRQLQELADTQLVHVNRFDFIKDQLLYFINSFFIILFAFVGFAFYPPFRKYRVVGLTYLIAIILFVFLKGKSYYAIGLYPVLLAFGAVYISEISQVGWKRIFRPVAFMLIVILFIPFILIGFPNKSPEQIKSKIDLYRSFGMLRWEDGEEHHLPQDFADMVGWRELAEKIDVIYDTISYPNQTLVLCDNYGQAGAINYYSKHKNINAVSFNADYINWFPLDNPIINVLFVKEKDDAAKELNDIAHYFHTATQNGSIENQDAREYGTSILVFQNAKVDINAIIKKEIQDLRKVE